MQKYVAKGGKLKGKEPKVKKKKKEETEATVSHLSFTRDIGSYGAVCLNILDCWSM